MDPSELYLATQQGVVDGFEYPLPDLLALKMYEVIKFVSLDAHTTDFFLISTNKKTWEAMPPEEQKMMQAAMKTATDWQWKEQPAEIDSALARAEDAGGGERDHAGEQEAVHRGRRGRCTSSSSRRSARSSSISRSRSWAEPQ